MPELPEVEVIRREVKEKIEESPFSLSGWRILNFIFPLI